MTNIDYEALEREYAENGEECTGNCAGCSADCGKSQVTPKYAKRIFAILSGKGGTGKSVVTALIANALAKKGLNVGIIDADIAGPTMHLLYGLDGLADSDEKQIFPMETANGVKLLSMGNVYDKPESPILWEGKQLAGGAQFFYTEAKWENIDVLLVDMPTGLGDVPLQMYTVIPFDGAIMVCTPDALCDYMAIKSINLCKMVMIPPLGVVENKVAMPCGHCGQVSTLGSDPAEHAEKLGLPMAAALPYDVELAIMAELGRIAEYDCPDIEPLADTLETLIKEA